MAGFRIESGTAKGRGFGTVDGVPSFLNRLKTWIAKAIVDGGPGWFIIDDQSALPVSPYIVVSNVAGQPTNASRSKVLKFAFSGTADTVVVSLHMFHNVTTHVSNTAIQAFTLTTAENNEYGYNFRGGQDVLHLMTNVGGVWDYVSITKWDGHTLLVEDDFDASLSQNWIVETGDNNNQFGSYHLLQNIGPHLDADGKLFAFFDHNGSTSNQFFLYKGAARTSDLLIAQSTMSNTITTTGMIAQNSSGVAGNVARTAVVADDSDVEIDFKLYLQAGQGALFTAGNFYYIWDYVGGSNNVGYFKVLAVIGDTLVVSGLNSLAAFTAGACISPYGHRWIFNGNQATGNGGNAVTGSVIPYFSSHDSPSMNRFTGNSHAATTWMSGAVGLMNPNDASKFAVMRPWVVEFVDHLGAGQAGGVPNINVNRMYGKLDYQYVSAVSGMAQMSFGRVINGSNYITYLTDANSAYLFLDSESLS